MEVSIGILVVGSLYWDDDVRRVAWRNDRLNLKAAQRVNAPIRYGRRSESRGNAYTMVFSEALSRSDENSGCALAIPCNQTIRSPKDLVSEAELLWAAESPKSQKKSHNKPISAHWGCVALAVNPATQVPAELHERWAARVQDEEHYGELESAEGEGAIVTKAGILNMPWPRSQEGAPLELDAVLATATAPSLVNGRYPTAQEVADAWLKPKGEGHVHYFWQNRESEITTFQDLDIEKCLAGESAA